MQGHLVIADISGYTQFLTDSELDHANGIVGDLLTSIVTAIQAPLTVAAIEGDAVFMYGEASLDLTGQTIVESVERLYTAFRSALETMVLNTTCQCNACVNIASLGLKIVMHCGEYALSSVAGITTLSGPDVIAVHRLLKNHIVEETGIDDYLLVTQACVDELGVEDMVASWIPHAEAYEHIGEVAGYVSSLRDVWEFTQLQTEVKVAKSEVWVDVTVQSSAPPAVIWDHLIDPRKRLGWLSVADAVDVAHVQEGRVGAGTEFHCAHGDGEVSLFTVIDMRPHSYVTFVAEFLDGSFLTYTYYLMPSGTGTRLNLLTRPPAMADGTARDDLAEAHSDGWEAAILQNLQNLVGMADAATAAST